MWLSIKNTKWYRSAVTQLEENTDTNWFIRHYFLLSVLNKLKIASSYNTNLQLRSKQYARKRVEEWELRRPKLFMLLIILISIVHVWVGVYFRAKRICKVFSDFVRGRRNNEK